MSILEKTSFEEQAEEDKRGYFGVADNRKEEGGD